MEALPTEILDMILNGLDANGVPFLHPAWRFAARMTHPRWTAVIASAGAVKPGRASLFRDTWSSGADDGRRPYICRCSVCMGGFEEHVDFGACLASGRLVSARCAIGRPWVFECCQGGAVPMHHQTIAILLSMPVPMSDADCMAQVIAPYIVDGDHTASGHRAGQSIFAACAARVEALRRRVAAAEFAQCLCDTLVRCGRADLVRALVTVCPDLDHGHAIEQLILNACHADNVEIVEDALLRAYPVYVDDATDIVRKWCIWEHAAAGGTSLLERLLVLCGHRDCMTPPNDDDDDAGAAREKGQRETCLSEMAHLARPAADLSWQRSAARSGNIDALVLGERYGVPVRAHKLARSVDMRAGHACLRWIAARTLAERVTPKTVARVHGGLLVSVVMHAASATSGFVACAQHGMWTSDVLASPQSDGRLCAKKGTEYQDTIDALCCCLAPVETMSREATHLATGFIYDCLDNNYKTHTPTSLLLMARVIRTFSTTTIESIGPQLWGRLVEAIVYHAAFEALDDLISMGASCALWERDLWATVVERTQAEIRRPTLPPHAGPCSDCATLACTRAAEFMGRVVTAACAGETSSEAGDTHDQGWRAVCHPRPIDPTVLGETSPDRGLPSVTALRALLELYGLLA
ncbi:hypothetical protein pclt_cds_247 [Pandoravirus celtis]|uniref:F-box incomplete domain containing protein n=1 Tax=Pandoravirus celtis TaxID=2568002 RepID=A0A4D6EGB4_9VIRU|nr:hypothetical protein pclt_cds_247 [Pandoravirus celtis]